MKKLMTICLVLLAVVSLNSAGILIKNAVEGTYLNLKQCDLDIQILDQVAITTATVKYQNQTSNPTSTIYVFPMHPDASATNLSWNINGVWHNAVITPGDQGSVVPPGSTINPNIESYIGKTPLVFPITEQVPANGQLIFRLSYVELLEYHDGSVSYSFPADYHYLVNPPLDSLNVSIEINGTRNITGFNLPDFPETQVIIDGTSAMGGLNLTSFIPELDIDLTYTLSMDNLGASTFSTMVESEYVPDELGDGFFMSVIEPEPTGDVIQKYFTFVMDRSSAMFGTSIEQAKNAASYMINNLNPGDYFNIVDFSTIASTFAVNHVPFTEDNRDLALTYVDNLSPQGSCNISGSFDMAIPQFSTAPTDVASVLVFLSKGIPSVGIINTSELVSHINSLSQTTGRDINIFCFGVGTNVNFQLLSQISAANNGMATYVGLNELEDVLIDFYTKIRNPILLNPVLTIDQGQGQITEVYPNPLPNLYLGTQMLLCGRYTQNVALLSFDIDGYSLGTAVNYHFESELSIVPIPQHVFLMKIWAKLKIEFLMNLYYQLDPTSPAAIALHDQIVDISLDYGVLCSFTNFSGGEVAVDDETVPVLLPPLRLLGNYPNPFNPDTNIRFEVNLPSSRELELNIYNLRGQLIRTLMLHISAPGVCQIHWDGKDEAGTIMPSGVYYYCLNSESHFAVGRMLMIK
jgi:Ca-activated chloride channel homolog